MKRSYISRSTIPHLLHDIEKPILEYSGEEDYYRACHDFYELICGGGEEEEEEESFIIPKNKG